jgi:Fic family protein
VEQTSEQGVATARRLLELFQSDEQKIASLGRAASSGLRVHMELKRSPLLAVPRAAQRAGLSQPTVQKSLDHLAKLGIVQEITGKRRSRIYQYSSYLKILDEGTEPLEP